MSTKVEECGRRDESRDDSGGKLSEVCHQHPQRVV